MVVNFFGKRGSGKTTVIRGCLPHCRGPVVVIDILGNYLKIEKKTDIKTGKVITRENPYVETKTIADAIDRMGDYLDDPKPEKKIIVLQTTDPNLAIDYISAALWDACQGTLVIDEADAFDIPEAPCFDQIIRYGRNRNVDVITGVRRPAELSRNISAAANKMFAFGTHEPRDVEYFEKTIFGPKAEELIKLPRFHGIFVDYDEQVVGNFHIDIEGQVFYDKKESFEQNSAQE